MTVSGFINLDEIPSIEPARGCHMRTPYGEHLMLSYLEMEDGADEAIRLLDRSISQGYGHRAWLEHDADLAPLRGHPQFQALLERMGDRVGLR